jgi:hypothetical protein|tara:strand:+ start:407 stop:1360 length:954 start_codon:yes stop_codon:yes gene_type:complete
MRQLIIGADVAGPYTGAAEGALGIQEITATGVPGLVNKAKAAVILANDAQFRFVRVGATAAEALQASPWFRPSELSSYTAKTYNAAVAKKQAYNFVTGGAIGDDVTIKVIFTTEGYEPFDRYNFSVKLTATTATQAATDAAAIITAAIADGTAPKLVTAVVATDGSDNSAVLIESAAGERFELAFEANGSDATMATVTNGAVAFEFPVGTAAKLLKEELEQEGRENSNYDRFTALPDEVLTYVDSTEIYNEYSLRFGNPAQGQIRGVDNVREIKLAIPSGANVPYLDGATSGDSSAESFEYIMLALTGRARLSANGD